MWHYPAKYDGCCSSYVAPKRYLIKQIEREQRMHLLLKPSGRLLYAQQIDHGSIRGDIATSLYGRALKQWKFQFYPKRKINNELHNFAIYKTVCTNRKQNMVKAWRKRCSRIARHLKNKANKTPALDSRPQDNKLTEKRNGTVIPHLWYSKINSCVICVVKPGY